MKWFTFPPLPVDLRICYEAPTGLDRSTPEEVRIRYDESSRGKFVFWASADGSLIGFKEGIDEVTLRNDEFERMVLVRWLPGRGSGMISLETRNSDRGIIGSKCYSSGSDEWIRLVVDRVRSVIGERVVEEPAVYDT